MASEKLQTLSKSIAKTILAIIAFVFVLFAGMYVLLAFLFTHPDSVTGEPAVSNFSLSPDSRLPKWFNIPNGYDRKNLTVEIAYYGNYNEKPNFKASLIANGKKLETKYGFHENLNDVRSKPSFIRGTIDGIDEIIEHKAAGPIFYISDSADFKK